MLLPEKGKLKHSQRFVLECLLLAYSLSQDQFVSVWRFVKGQFSLRELR